ncbi:MAG TPA: nucleoside triphosphate pyrophosphohydrolase [Gemmatimonadota bacterium]|nr:nucleoside triphosphate pyrophosphohydrolase [Gemmatimonadota bacterium]
MPDAPRPADSSATEFPPTFQGVLALLRRLRGPGGCPWDAEQTPRSLLPYLLEEAHEAAAAIEAGDDRDTVDELGDLLLHLAFQIAIAEEEERFALADVAGRIIDKMVRRHPHVFGDAEYAGEGHQAMWERLKREEKAGEPAAGHGAPVSVLGEIPGGLPALVRAHRIQQKVATVGFDWAAPEGALEKAREELEETVEVAGDPERLEEEFGDLLFAIVNWGRLLDLHPELALQRANRKFEGRFRRLEALARERGLDLEALTLAELDGLWDEVKAGEGASR